MEQHLIPEAMGAYLARSRQDDRRTQPRLRCKGVAELSVLCVAAKLPGTLLDLSVTGCCIETAGPVPPIENPVVEVILNLKGFTLRLAGIVRHVRDKRRAGIEFVDVTERKAQQIQELVAELIERENECAMEAEQEGQEEP